MIPAFSQNIGAYLEKVSQSNLMYLPEITGAIITTELISASKTVIGGVCLLGFGIGIALIISKCCKKFSVEINPIV